MSLKSLMNVPTIALFCYLGRLLYTGASIGDSVVIIGLSSLYAGWVYLESKKEFPVNKAILDRIVELEEALKVTKTQVDGLKLGSHLRR